MAILSAVAKAEAKRAARKKLADKIAKQVSKTPTSKLQPVDPVGSLGKSSQKVDVQIKQSGGTKRFTGASKDKQDITQKKGKKIRLALGTASKKDKALLKLLKNYQVKKQAGKKIEQWEENRYRSILNENPHLKAYLKKKTGGPIVKKPMGGKVYKNTVSRKHGGAIGTRAALRGFGKGYKKG